MIRVSEVVLPGLGAAKLRFSGAMVAIDQPAVVFSEERAMHGMKYKVALHASEEGFAVSVPGLPGCWSQGSTEAEALENIKQAIEEPCRNCPACRIWRRSVR